jgi:SSS family solute:Na+ symporter
MGANRNRPYVHAAIQAFILLLGVVLIIAYITIDLGGLAQWWPHEWAREWDPPRLWFHPGARVTFSSAFLSALIWFICTAGSDQMAVQRYLATRNVKAARRMFAMSLSVNALAMVLLALMGLALLAYFRANPQMLADGQTVASSADQLLPRFIVAVLPPGLSGLVIAALLAAAMSSLSSGLSSSSSVITVDFVDRFRSERRDDADQVRLSRLISWTLGVVVVGISLLMGLIPGNLLEVTTKVANLLVAPLFVLFFMAMFVSWASPLGTIIAAMLSLAVGIAIAFFQAYNLSFLWIMPCSLATGILAGLTLSLPGLARWRRATTGP